MKNLFKKLKKHWITVWLVAAVLAVSVFVVIASYTGIYSVKRVVSTKASAGVLFSSNSMQSYSGSVIPSRHITTSQSTGSYTYNLTVCDFAQSDPLTRYVSESGLSYDLTAQLCVKINGSFYPVNDTANVSDAVRNDAKDKDYSIQFVSDGGTNVASDNEVKKLSQGNEVSFPSQVIKPQVTGNSIPNGTNKYAITFDGYELGDNQQYEYYIKLTAHPTNGDNSLQNIACYLYLTKMVVTDSAWEGRIQDNGSLADRDAYNYILEGSGSGTITVRWNSNYIDVSEIFIAQNGLNVVTEQPDQNSNVWKHFDLPVSDAVGRYEIQLYKKNPDGDYSDVSVYISSSWKVSS